MSNFQGYDWSTLAESLRSAATLQRDLRNLHSELQRSGSNVAEQVAHAHSYPRERDTAANAKAGEALRILRGMADQAAACATLSRGLNAKLKEAVAKVDEFHAQQKSFGPTLDV